MPCNSTDFQLESFRIKHDDDKLFNKLLSKESSKSNPSLRVYYGDVSGAVPFVWETRPGTPKHTFFDNCNIPPLTPPPSYFTNNSSNNSKKHSRSKLVLHTLLRRMNPKISHHWASSPKSSSSTLSSLSWSSSSRSSFSDPTMTPTAYIHRRRRFSSWGSSFDDRAMDDQEKSTLHTSKFCFGSSKECDGRLRGGYSLLIVKKALLSIVGRGSA